MIQKFVNLFMEHKDDLRQVFAKKHPADYEEIVTEVVKVLHDEEDYECPDFTRITEIDHGDYQGTVLYVIAASNYQPSRFWTTRVYYGSCSGCDILEGIRASNYYEDTPTPKQVEDYLGLALNIVQRLKEVGDEG